MHHPTDRIAHTTTFVTPVVEHWLEREIAQWVHPMKDRSDDPSHHERTLLPRSYISLPKKLRKPDYLLSVDCFTCPKLPSIITISSCRSCIIKRSLLINAKGGKHLIFHFIRYVVVLRSSYYHACGPSTLSWTYTFSFLVCLFRTVS